MTMKEEYTAIDMATAAADGFRAGQRAAQSAGVPDVSAMARVLSDRSADACNIDRTGNWAMYGQEYIEDVQAMLAAATTVKAEQVQCLYCQGHGDVTRISGQTAESYSEHNEECPECKGTGLAPSLPAAGSTELPEPDFTLDGGSQPCYYAETVQRIVAALSAQQSAHVSVPRELLADLVSQDHDTRVQAERRLYYALLNGGEA